MNDSTLCTLSMLARRMKRFGLPAKWLREEAEAGRLPHFKAGRRILFDADAVEAALIQRAREAVQHDE